MATVNHLINQLDDGAGNAQHAAALEIALGMPTGHTQEPTRALITEAIVHGDIPIASGDGGYWLVNTQPECDRVVDALQKRIDGLQARIDGIKRGWAKRHADRINGGNWPK